MPVVEGDLTQLDEFAISKRVYAGYLLNLKIANSIVHLRKK